MEKNKTVHSSYSTLDVYGQLQETPPPPPLYDDSEGPINEWNPSSYVEDHVEDHVEEDVNHISGEEPHIEAKNTSNWMEEESPDDYRQAFRDTVHFAHAQSTMANDIHESKNDHIDYSRNIEKKSSDFRHFMGSSRKVTSSPQLYPLRARKCIHTCLSGF